MFAETWFKLCFLAAILWQFTVERFWPVVRTGLWVLGLATAVSLIVFWVNIALYERETGRRYAGPPIQVSPVARRVAAKFAPKLQELAGDNKEQVIAASGGIFNRAAMRTVYPAGLKAIPTAAEIGCDRALTYLDTLSMSEIATLMLDHADAKGSEVHYTIRYAAERE